jgi:hypothetical protein
MNVRPYDSTADLKARLVALLRQGNADEQTFAVTLPDAERERTGTVDNWAPKEYIGHLAYWRNREAERVQALTEGSVTKLNEDFETLNTESFAYLSQNTWESAMAQSRQSTATLISAIEAAPEEVLLGPIRPPKPDDVATATLIELIVNNGYLHPQQHLAEITAARGDEASAGAMQRRALYAIYDLGAGPSLTSNARYNVACSFARSGDRTETLDLLRQAFADNPRLIAWARQDSDLDPLRDDPAFQEMVAENSEKPEA